MYTIKLTPVEPCPGAVDVRLEEGETAIGRGWNGHFDAQLSRKQLVLRCDVARGSVTATRVSQNPSFVKPTTRDASGGLTRLEANCPTQLNHGDTLYLVGTKYPYLVSLLAVPVEELEGTLPFEPTQALLDPYLQHLHQADREEGEDMPNADPEERWTDDEDNNNITNFHQSDTVSAAKVRICRADFSDESEYLSPFELEVPSESMSQSQSESDLEARPASPAEVKKYGKTAVSPVKPKLKAGASKLAKKRVLKVPVPSSEVSDKQERDNYSFNDDNGDITSVADAPLTSSPIHPSPSPRVTRGRRAAATKTKAPALVTAEERRRLVLVAREERQRKKTQARTLAPNDSATEDEARDIEQSSNTIDASTRVKKRLRKIQRVGAVAELRSRVGGSGSPRQAIAKQRRVTAYGLFSKQEKKSMKNQNPSLTVSEITSLLKQRFRNLPQSDRDHYGALAMQENGSNVASDDTTDDAASLRAPPTARQKQQSESSGESEEIASLARRGSLASLNNGQATRPLTRRNHSVRKEETSSGSEEIQLMRKPRVGHGNDVDQVSVSRPCTKQECGEEGDNRDMSPELL
ncbi:hypothetical protein BC830DRAFT_1130840 [Chytriomyces sp. MP71]|nr:hypothetical protein BC830DRAFT_1130840 [Chytriomyces sp. MP71]